MKLFLQQSLLLLLVFDLGWSKPHSYDLEVKIDPSSHSLESVVKVTNPPDSCFYLNKDFEIISVHSDGEPVSFERDVTKLLPYTIGSAVILKGKAGKELVIKYVGKIDETVNNVNMITTELVELALYTAWYPMFEGNTYFDFQLSFDLPTRYVPATNGEFQSKKDHDSRSITRWQSTQPTFDIVLFASSKFKKRTANQMGTNIEIFFEKVPTEAIESKIDILKEAMDQLSDYYGAPGNQGLLRFVYSPRNGWGYSRIPLLVVPETYALNLSEQQFGVARDFHGSVHEMAHFWWLIADTNTTHDWINEGLAEYSAFRLSEQYFGKAFSEQLIGEYRDHASKSESDSCIAETEATSHYRYVNRYEKTTLMFIEARRRFGEENLDRVFETLHRKFAGTQQATTEIFLGEVETQLGPEAKNFFSTVLFQKNWCDL